MKISLHYRLLLHDEKGRLVKDTGLIPSHSYVLQFLRAIELLLDGKSGKGKDIANTDQWLVVTDWVGGMAKTLVCKGGVGNDDIGILVGTNDGATAEDNTNYNLDTKIIHSATGEAGKLNYRDVTMVAPTDVAGNIDFDISRAFINETAATITVKEIGIIVHTEYLTGTFHYFLLLRDVVADFAVTAGYTLTVVYTMRTTV